MRRGGVCVKKKRKNGNIELNEQKHEHCFYLTVCSAGIFKKVNLALLTYQHIVEVGSLDCTTYL